MKRKKLIFHKGVILLSADSHSFRNRQQGVILSAKDRNDPAEGHAENGLGHPGISFSVSSELL